MPETISEVDAYIEKQPEWAQEILLKLRHIFHKACPKVIEKIRWRMPQFDHEGPMISVSAHKAHVRVTFWKGGLMADEAQLFTESEREGMGHVKLSTVKEIPTQKVLVPYIKEAMKLNEEGAKIACSTRNEKEEIEMPAEFAAALKKNQKAGRQFDAFAPSYQRDYIEWIADAKTEKTMLKRIDQGIEWIAEGKPRNWKYMPKYKDVR